MPGTVGGSLVGGGRGTSCEEVGKECVKNDDEDAPGWVGGPTECRDGESGDDDRLPFPFCF